MQINLQTDIFKDIAFFQVILAMIAIFFLLIAWKYMSLLVYLQKIKKAGVLVYFRLPVGLTSILADGAKGDSFGVIKEAIKKDPKMRLFATHLMHQPFLFLVDPSLIKTFLADQSKYVKADFLKPYNMLLGKGLVFSNGRIWKKHRKIVTENFRFDFIASQIPTIVEFTHKMFQEEMQNTSGKRINIMKAYQEITGGLVCSIFFGKDVLHSKIDGVVPTVFLAKLITLLGTISLSPFNVFFGTSIVKLGLFKNHKQLLDDLHKLRKFCSVIIDNRRKAHKENAGSLLDKKDFLDVILSLETQSDDSEDLLSDEEILQEFITFFLAGMDTTGHLLTMMTYYFNQETPKNQELLLNDANAIVEAGTNVTFEQLNKSETLNAFIKETLRLGGPTPLFFARKSLEDHYIGDVFVPKGANVNCAFVANNNNPKYYKDTKKFNLNRWIKGNEDFAQEAAKDPYVFLPFSAGPRNCVGQHFAQMEAKIIFSIFLSQIRFIIPEDYKLKMNLIFLYEPYDTLFVDLIKRDSNS